MADTSSSIPSSAKKSGKSKSKKSRSSKRRKEKRDRRNRKGRRGRRKINFGLVEEDETVMLLKDGGDGEVRKDFEWSSKDVLGAGAFAKVYAGTSVKTGEHVAIKVIDKGIVGKEVTPKALQTEVAVLKDVKHPYVIQLRGVYEDKYNLYIVTELALGGELFDRVLNKGAYTEMDAATMVQRLLSAIKYLHDRGIVHRDLKPENLLLASKDNDLDIRIADFGLARVVGSNTLIQSVVGSPNYVAPEVLQGKGYWKQADLWSIGVITYILLCGYPPFTSPDIRDLLDMIQSGEFEYEEDYWSEVSDQAKDFINHLLVVDPDHRFDVDQALKHTWFSAASAKMTKSLTIGNKLKETMEEWKGDREVVESESEDDDHTNEGDSATSVLYEAKSRPVAAAISTMDELSVMKCKPTSVFYSFLYDNFADYADWKRSKDLEETTLAALHKDESILLLVAYLNGSPVGFAELNLKAGAGIVEISCIGMSESLSHTSLTRMLFEMAVSQAWSHPTTTSIRFRLGVDSKIMPVNVLEENGFSTH